MFVKGIAQIRNYVQVFRFLDLLPIEKGLLMYTPESFVLEAYNTSLIIILYLLKKCKSFSFFVNLPNFVKSSNTHSSDNKHSNKTRYHYERLEYICPNHSFKSTLNIQAAKSHLYLLIKLSILKCVHMSIHKN